MIARNNIIALVMGLSAVSGAIAAETPIDITKRHVANAKIANVAGIVSDYAENAVVVTPPGMASPNGIYSGKKKVAEFFTWLTNAGNLPGVRTMVATSEVVAPGTVLMHWTQFPGAKNEVKGIDVFVIRDGKIQFQSVAPAK